jgi:hypothetical protein
MPRPAQEADQAREAQLARLQAVPHVRKCRSRPGGGNGCGADIEAFYWRHLPPALRTHLLCLDKLAWLAPCQRAAER